MENRFGEEGARQMDAFGVRFEVDDPDRFETLRSLYAEVRRDKDAGQFRDPAEWVRLVPDEVKARFSWPTSAERRHWLNIRNSAVIAVPDPSRQLGRSGTSTACSRPSKRASTTCSDCVLVKPGVAELRINPHAYPYGGVGPLIALAEAFGFTVLGVNEYGKYQPRQELLAEP